MSLICIVRIVGGEYAGEAQFHSDCLQISFQFWTARLTGVEIGNWRLFNLYAKRPITNLLTDAKLSADDDMVLLGRDQSTSRHLASAELNI